MGHGKKFNHLGRKTAHRKAMLANMASSLIEHKRITTTLAKAKEIENLRLDQGMLTVLPGHGLDGFFLAVMQKA